MMERETFYAVAAQVIPVLLLAFLLEARLQPRAVKRLTGKQIAREVLPFTLLMLFAIAGEFVALTNLWRGKELGGGWDVLPFFVIGFELVGILALALIAILELEERGR
jgi:hypothetical protein